MNGRIKKGIALFAVLSAGSAVISVISATLAIIFACTLTYDAMLMSTAISCVVSMIFAYLIPFFLAAIVVRLNMNKVAKCSMKIGTADSEKIAQALMWRIKPTLRLVKRCIRKKYITN